MYPVWEVPYLTGGIVLALIATFHILPSHLTIGAMWFNVYVETKAYKENRPELLEFIKKYSLLLLIFSYVFGSLSGIGIWYAATVANPRGISGLIHNYVWGWATEWVFFIIEVTAIFIYYYTLNKIDRKTHLKIGWIFAISSWITMIIIVGILAFMLTPGKWPQTGGFFDGFFNQSYWPQLLMRTAFMFVIAAAYAAIVATRLKDDAVKTFVIKSASTWGIAGLVAGTLFFLLYTSVLPATTKDLFSMLLKPGLKNAMIASVGITLAYFIFLLIKPLSVRLVPALFAIAVIFAGIWSAERAREMIRKPYIISQYMYSNQIINRDIPAKGVQSDIKKINENGLLKTAPFVPEHLRTIDERNKIEAGRLIAVIQCSACHTLDKKGLRPLPVLMKQMGASDPAVAESIIDAIGGIPYMPGFAGTMDEKKALAAYLSSIAL